LPDTRVAEHARLVVNYSLEVKKGDFVIVSASELALPLLQAMAAEVAKAGAYMQVWYRHESINRAYMMNATEETLSFLPPSLEKGYRNADCIVHIICSANEAELSDVPSHKLRDHQKATEPLSKVFFSKRWNITLHPTYGLAQEARRSLEAYSDFVYSATLRDWPLLGEEMAFLARRLKAAKRVRIVGSETDISFSVEGRTPEVDDGKKNLPGGEVFTSPVEETVNGHVYFDLPFNLSGRELHGVRLKYVNGEIEESSAESGEELLKELIRTDEGARRMGELGIGMNRGITECSKNVLFDEKMGDTIHMAVGRSFEECGGKNKSGIHIDMVKNMKDEGTIYFDEDVVYRNGKFAWEV